jgi:hypothetical protein
LKKRLVSVFDHYEAQLAEKNKRIAELEEKMEGLVNNPAHEGWGFLSQNHHEQVDCASEVV